MKSSQEIIREARDTLTTRKLPPSVFLECQKTINQIATALGLPAEGVSVRPLKYTCATCNCVYLPKDADKPTCPECFMPFRAVRTK